jgi:tetratricopeptide (TPR) repeat protein
MRKAIAGTILSSMLVFAGAKVASGAAPERWVEARSTHFTVLTDAGEKQAQRVASQFERMHMVFRTLLPEEGDDAGPPIVVVAVRDRKAMQALEPAEYLGKDRVDLSGFFLRAPDKNYILVRLDAEEDHAYANVYHEYTHYTLRKADGWLPLWLNEGLAQFYENTDIDDKMVWLGQANADELRFLGRNDLMPIETLLKVNRASPYYHDEQKGSMFYAESWALTHFLIASDRIQGTHRMRDYAERMAEGADAVSAARAVFGDLDKLQQGLSDYVLQRKFMYFMMPATLEAKDAMPEVQPVSLAEADAVRGDVLIYTNRAWDAKALAEKALREDPDNALAHESMGYLRFREGDIVGAKQWFREAMELDEHSYLGHYYYAMMAMRSGAKDEDDAVEASLRAAIGLNGEFAPAYDALAMFYAARHERLEEAHALNVKAVELEGNRLSYRLNCAEVLLEQRQVAEALDVLQDAMRLAKTPDDVAVVEGRIARVEQYQQALNKAVGEGE